MRLDYEIVISEIIDRYVAENDFWSTEVIIPEDDRVNWLCMRTNPKHFSQGMFLGHWSDDSKIPGPEPVRLVRAMDMPDNSLRIIGRQGNELFVLIVPDCL